MGALITTAAILAAIWLHRRSRRDAFSRRLEQVVTQVTGAPQ